MRDPRMAHRFLPMFAYRAKLQLWEFLAPQSSRETSDQDHPSQSRLQPHAGVERKSLPILLQQREAVVDLIEGGGPVRHPGVSHMPVTPRHETSEPVAVSGASGESGRPSAVGNRGPPRPFGQSVMKV